MDPAGDGQAAAEAVEQALGTATPAVRQPLRTKRMSDVVGGLTVVNISAALAGLVTGSLQARALGPDGRGDLAAILVPVTLAAQVLSLAMGAYAARELARKRSVGDIAGTLGTILLGVGAAGAVAGITLSPELARGRDTVYLFLVIGFALLPVSLSVGLLYSMLGGLERWRLLIISRLIPVIVGLVGIVVLYIAGALTVASAAIVALAGGFISAVPLATILRRAGPLRFRPAMAREGTMFSLKTWVGTVASLTNNRLDQLVMVSAVPARELGLYAVAVTLSSVPTFVTGAIGPPLLTRISKGDREIVPRALRTILAISTAMSLGAAAVSPFMLPLIFGRAFDEATDMTLVLCVASLPLAGVTVLSTALIAEGRPSLPSWGEVIGLVVTAGGLIALLGPLGGLGAAIVSLAAYGSNFVFQLHAARQTFPGSLRDFLLPRRTDVEWALAQVARLRR